MWCNVDTLGSGRHNVLKVVSVKHYNTFLTTVMYLNLLRHLSLRELYWQLEVLVVAMILSSLMVCE